MKTHRRPTMPASFTRKPHVSGVCRWCDLPIPKGDGGRLWHAACVAIYRVACFSQDQRLAVFRRDAGVCAECGIDCERMRRRHSWRSLEGRWSPALRWRAISSLPDYGERLKRIEARWCRFESRLRVALEKRRKASSAAGWRAWDASEGAWWQADHRLPLIESQGRLEYFLLSNLQTLCHRCHAKKSGQDRKRNRTKSTCKTTS